MSGRHAARWTLRRRRADRRPQMPPAGLHSAAVRPLMLQSVSAPLTARRHVNAAAS